MPFGFLPLVAIVVVVGGYKLAVFPIDSLALKIGIISFRLTRLGRISDFSAFRFPQCLPPFQIVSPSAISAGCRSSPTLGCPFVSSGVLSVRFSVTLTL